MEPGHALCLADCAFHAPHTCPCLSSSPLHSQLAKSEILSVGATDKLTVVFKPQTIRARTISQGTVAETCHGGEETR